ncbi:MAG: carboxylate--amine ligase, partial [Negativicutes bacterium]|nr:carboxylate--amine ligase [Negativicutes bacterium]
RQISPELEDAGRRTLKVFNVRERFFHLEFFRNKKDGRIISLEVNMRPPGGLTMDMFNWSCDIDLYREWANLVEFDRMDNPDYERKYYVAYIGRKNGKSYVHNHDEIMQRYGWAIVQNEPISGIFRNAIGDYAYLARSANHDEVMEIINFVHAKY